MKSTILDRLPKTSLATIIMAVVVYAQGKGYIGADEATLISSLMVALGLSVNLKSGKFK